MHMDDIITMADGTEVCHIPLKELHRYILNKISQEFSNMVQPCYYPDVSMNSKLYKDLQHMTNSNDKTLVKYAKERFTHKTIGNNSKLQIMYDPYTMLLVLITQSFLQHKDIAGASAAFHLFSLRYYTNLLYKFTTPKGSRSKICNVDYFQSALDNLSGNHMFTKQKTIPNSIMYYSREVLKRFSKALIEDDTPKIAVMIIELRTKISQSMKSFFQKYYQAHDERDKRTTSKEEMDYDKTHELKLRTFAGKITQDICVYHRIDQSAIQKASALIKFNKKLSVKYIDALSNPKFYDDIDTAIFLMIQHIKDTSIIQQMEFIDYVQKMLSIKVTNKQVYFKKTISQIHDEIIKILNLDEWYNKLSIQSKSISRNFIAYYLAFYIRRYM